MEKLAEKGYSAHNKFQSQWNYQKLDDLDIEYTACVLVEIEIDEDNRPNWHNQYDWYFDHTLQSNLAQSTYLQKKGGGKVIHV